MYSEICLQKICRHKNLRELGINNEQSLRTFINNKNGVMHNNMTEQKFRPLDILRNSMLMFGQIIYSLVAMKVPLNSSYSFILIQ